MQKIIKEMLLAEAKPLMVGQMSFCFVIPALSIEAMAYGLSQALQQCGVGGWVRLPLEPNIGDKVIVYREADGSYAEGVYEKWGNVLISPGYFFGGWDKWLLVEPVR